MKTQSKSIETCEKGKNLIGATRILWLSDLISNAEGLRIIKAIRQSYF